MRKLILVCCLTAIGQTNLFAQAFSINTDGSTANPSAMLDVKSTSKGVLIPRMTRTERNALVSPATGLLIFQSGPDSIGFHYYDGAKWTWMISNANADSLAWKTGGNAGTNAANHFLGTNDNTPLLIKVNNVERARFTTNNELGIGTSTPNSTYGFAKVEIASEGNGAPTDLLLRNAVNDAGYAPGLVFQHARGTLSVPLSVTSGDYLSAIAGMSYTGSYVQSWGMDTYADGPVSAGIVPTRIQFATQNLAGNYAYRMTIKNDGKTGINTSNPLTLFEVASGNLLNTGTFGSGSSLEVSGAGTRMFFYPKKGAFRAGSVSGTQWDDPNIGNYSVAVGNGTIAPADYAIAIGEADTIGFSGQSAVALGSKNNVSGPYSFAAGANNTTSGSANYGIAMGYSNSVNSYGTIAIGHQNTVTNLRGFAAGFQNYVSGFNAVAIGTGDSALIDNAFAAGAFNVVRGSGGVALGIGNSAPSFGETTIGAFATQYTALNAAGPNAADRLFTIGNGSPLGGRSNALVMLKNGNTGLGTSTPHSTLQVDGTMAVGITTNIAGGTSGSPVSLANAKYYIGLSPADGVNNNYQLPSPVTNAGRVYVIRNNSAVNNAVLSTAAGLFFPGSSASGTAIYTLFPGTSVKTVMVIADGTNWTIMKMD
jgi:hypothetical protein